jgi:DNA polymerase elongation subunit (family B)
MQENEVIFDLSTDGLNPMNNRIIGITTKCNSEERIFSNRNEQLMLIAFCEYLRSRRFTKIVGFNIDEFDLPMLIIRCIKHRVAIPSVVHESIDLRKVVFNGKERCRGKLIEFQKLLGVNFPESRYRKLDMYLMWGSPDINDLREFLLQDVRITARLLEQVQEVGLV